MYTVQRILVIPEDMQSIKRKKWFSGKLFRVEDRTKQGEQKHSDINGPSRVKINKPESY